SAAKQISPISEGAPARSDNDADLREHTLSQSESAGLGSSPAIRRRLPDEWRALTHHFSIAGQEGYLTVGAYEDGLPGEIFITMAKQGSTISLKTTKPVSARSWGGRHLSDKAKRSESSVE